MININKIINLQNKIKIDVISDLLDIETINNYFKSLNLNITINVLGDKIYRDPLVLYNVYCISNKDYNNNNFYDKYPEYKNDFNNMICIYPNGHIELLF
jgi:hypothetical protein